MAAELPEAGMVALCIGISCADILKPLLSFLEGGPARGPALDAAVLLVGLTVVMAYLAGVVLVLAPAAGAPVVLAAFRQYVLLVCAPLVLLFVLPFLFLAAGGWFGYSLPVGPSSSGVGNRRAGHSSEPAASELALPLSSQFLILGLEEEQDDIEA